jgi:hypothetical protein
MAAGDRIGAERWGCDRVGCNFAVANGARESCPADANAADLPRKSVVNTLFAAEQLVRCWHFATIRRDA